MTAGHIDWSERVKLHIAACAKISPALVEECGGRTELAKRQNAKASECLRCMLATVLVDVAEFQ